MSSPHPDPLADMLTKPHELDGKFESQAKTVTTCISDAALTSIAVATVYSRAELWMLVVARRGQSRDGYAIMVAPFYLGHRLAAFVKFGDPPLGTEVDHTCSVRCCVNPDHMRYVTHHENVLAGDVGGHNFQPLKTHCPYGHPLSGSNLRIKKTKTRSGFSRQCRSCDRMGRARKGQPRAIKGEV